MHSDTNNSSCLLYGPLDARFEDRPFPVIENPHDVIIRIAYTGVCGSDVSIPYYDYFWQSTLTLFSPLSHQGPFLASWGDS